MVWLRTQWDLDEAEVWHWFFLDGSISSTQEKQNSKFCMEEIM